jgi:hypothetical protein
MITLLVIAYLSVLLIAALPLWSYNRNWGYYPSSAVTVVLGTVLMATVI